MRKEADDIGPAAELDHWKHRMAKFSSLLDEIKTNRVRKWPLIIFLFSLTTKLIWLILYWQVRTVVGILHAAKSRTLKRWKELDSRITDAANEAKDNVKYLYTLDKYFGPLSKNTPQGEMMPY